MMKRSLHITFVLCGIFVMNIFFAHWYSTTEAADLERVNGLLCWNGDVNYPIWTTGNAFGNALEVSSAEILYEDQYALVIVVLDDTISYSKKSIIRQETMYFEESKQEGSVYWWHDGRSLNQLDPKKEKKIFGSLNDAYYAVKCALGKE